LSGSAEFVRSFYESFARGDLATVLAAMDPKIEWNEAEHVTFWPGGPLVGPDAVVQGVFTRIPATFGDTFRIEVTGFSSAGQSP
jgi:ketosteroid isomerase-like protein